MKGFVVSGFRQLPVGRAETFKLLKNSKFEYDVFTQKSNTLRFMGIRTLIYYENIQTVFSKRQLTGVGSGGCCVL